MPRTEQKPIADPGDATRLTASTLTRTRGVEPVDYDLADVARFERTVLETLQRMLASNAVDGENLRALDLHIVAGHHELELGLDVQRSHHESTVETLVHIADSNLEAARKGLDSAQTRLETAARTRQRLEAKLDRHDPEGNNHV